MPSYFWKFNCQCNAKDPNDDSIDILSGQAADVDPWKRPRVLFLCHSRVQLVWSSPSLAFVCLSFWRLSSSSCSSRSLVSRTMTDTWLLLLLLLLPVPTRLVLQRSLFISICTLLACLLLLCSFLLTFRQQKCFVYFAGFWSCARCIVCFVLLHLVLLRFLPLRNFGFCFCCCYCLYCCLVPLRLIPYT